jgi:hypothetical protein
MKAVKQIKIISDKVISLQYIIFVPAETLHTWDLCSYLVLICHSKLDHIGLKLSHSIFFN